ncbi:MAG: hypothetical protein ACM3W4_09135 [Ignavibacteriales bacterium]
MLRTVAASAALLGLTACATITAAPAGDYKVASGYTVTLGRQWSDMSSAFIGQPKKVRLLSIDGIFLDRLYLVDGLAPGEFIVKAQSKDKPTPVYRSGMSPTELVEFVADSTAALGYERVETSHLRPVSVGGTDGIRFDVAAQTTEGLDIAGTAMVVERGGKLYVNLYLAPKEHYYDAYLPEVEKVFASARFS